MKFRSEDGVAIKDFETQLANEFDFLKNAEFELSLSSVLEKNLRLALETMEKKNMRKS